MKFPLPWLKEYLQTTLTSDQIADTFTQLGVEVDGVGDDECFEVSLTPNLFHCASILGLARELSAVTETHVTIPSFSVQEKGDAIDKYTKVSIENKQSCPRYACRVITGVKVGPSPTWLQKRLEECGVRSVNNVVDITNFVLFEMGHPLHAFDLDKLEGKQIVVRNAKKGEKLTTLDGKEHFPTTDTLMICDAKKPVAIAGVMGGLDSEVGEDTKNILLESAYFEQAQVRRASKRCSISSEASKRFERGTDPNALITSLDRAADLIAQITLGHVAKNTIDLASAKFPRKMVSARLPRINQILGTQLAMSEVESIFKKLGMEIVSTKNETLQVMVPTYRNDISQEIDLVEEAGRLYGYNNIHTDKQTKYSKGSLPHCEQYLFEKQTRRALVSEGLQELATCDLISPSQAELISIDCMPSRSFIKLLNPSSADQSILRPSLLPGMLSVIKYNHNHDIHDIAGFEVGRIHFTSKQNYLEPTAASIVLAGKRAPHHWDTKPQDVDFFDLKGIVENFLLRLNIDSFSFEKSSYDNFHPGRQAKVMIGEKEVGVLGQVHPDCLKKADINTPVYFSELNLDDLQSAPKRDSKMTPLPQFPTSERDWTVTLHQTCPVEKVLTEIKECGSNLLESVTLLDVYHSEKLGSEWKNITFHFVYRDIEKTVSLKVVEKEHLHIIDSVQKVLNSKEGLN